MSGLNTYYDVLADQPKRKTSTAKIQQQEMDNQLQLIMQPHRFEPHGGENNRGDDSKRKKKSKRKRGKDGEAK